MREAHPTLTILGGGPAGLSVGYFARKRQLPFKIFEAQDRTGGNAITLEHQGFRFDSGAHRFHDKDPEVTRELFALMGDALQKIDAPSQIYHNGKYIGFPLTPLNLILKLGPFTFFKAGLELIGSRLKAGDGDGSFQSFANRMYGKSLARLFLLNYSEKLWGLPGEALSPRISGRRLKGLDLETFLKETFLGKRAGANHLEGSFYYPASGYGAIVDKLAEECGNENIHTNSRITKIEHDGKQIHHIQINMGPRIPVDQVVNTLPLSLFVQILDPEPERGIVELAQALRFRNLILVVLFLDRDRATDNASIYVSDPTIPITRIYEPKNRSETMAPPGRTSLCVEIPCNSGDALWRNDETELVFLVQSQLSKIGMVKDDEVIGGYVHRMKNAYPILDLKSEDVVSQLIDYAGRFRNLQLTGRNGLFLYTHLHDMLRFGMDVVDNW